MYDNKTIKEAIIKFGVISVSKIHKINQFLRNLETLKYGIYSEIHNMYLLKNEEEYIPFKI